MDEKLCETPITGEYVAKHMKASLGSNAILKSISDAKKIAVGQGYVSNILKLDLVWEGGDDRNSDLPESVVVKVPTVESLDKLMKTLASGDGDKMTAMLAQVVTLIHKVECDIYELFGKKPPVLMPKYYVALPVTDDAPGMIVLEDLSNKGTIPRCFIEGMTKQQLLATVTELARMHAWSLTTSVDWRSKIPSVEEREQLMRGFMAPMAGGLKVTKEKYPDEFGNMDVEKLVGFVTYEKFYELMVAHREFMEDVLIHGDAHMNNVMFDKKPDGNAGDKLVALLDFQAGLKGSPAYDVARLMNFSVSEQTRRDHEQDALHRYFDEMKSLAGDKFKVTFEQFRRMYDRLFALTAISMIASIPTMHHVMVKSEGEQKVKDEKTVLNRAKAFYEDATKILGL